MPGRALAILVATAALVAAGCSHQKGGSSTAIQVGGVDLVPASSVEDMCRRAADSVGFAVACPAVLPRGSHPFWAAGFQRGECDPGACGPARKPRWTWVGTHFEAAGGVGHVVVASVPEVVDPKRFVYLVGTVAPHPSRQVRVLAETQVNGQTAEYVHPSLDPRLDPAPRTGGVVFMGRTVLIWTEAGRTYAVGVSGPGVGERSVEAEIARRLTFVSR